MSPKDDSNNLKLVLKKSLQQLPEETEKRKLRSLSLRVSQSAGQLKYPVVYYNPTQSLYH